MRRTTPLIALALLLMSAAPAAAKEVASARICGPSACRTVTDSDPKDRAVLAFLPQGGPPGAAPKRASEWYRTTFTVREGRGRETFSNAVLPRARYIRGQDEVSGAFAWMQMSDDTAAAYRRLTRGLEPFPASTLRGVRRPPPAAPADAPAGGGALWLWIALGSCAAAAAAAWGWALVRRRRGPAGETA